MGDPAGIGGEIIVKALRHISKKSIPVIVGDRGILSELSGKLLGRSEGVFAEFGRGGSGDVECLDVELLHDVRFGAVSPDCGKAAYLYIIEALRLVFSGVVSAVVTCPINKAALHAAGVPFTGHTELLAHYGGTTDYVMMMANRAMRVALVTIHIPLRDVAPSLSAEKILKTITISHDAIRYFFSIEQPRIRVCGLNPHAGEEGLMGSEEDLIREAIRKARVAGMNVEGPFPADTLFHARACDAYVAMYHDQGLIPVKTIDFRRTVNITLGLPFVRTSPGHGTGFDIAGKGVADPSGLIEAYRMAEAMCRNIR
jgi:4-hydroxythreonine-4-phosphate dehydrogenase